LGLAWVMYFGDNNDVLALNCDGSQQFNGTPSWVSGGLDWFPSNTANTNTAFLVGDTNSLLGRYVGASLNIFACPAAAYFVAPKQRALGWSHRARSCAMDGSVGNGPKAPFWGNFFFARKSTDIHQPGPSDVWLFTDEHPDSIDDCILYTSPNPVTSLIEIPGSQHADACGITFADGHAEIHKWKGAFTHHPVQYDVLHYVSTPLNDPDMLWLAQHTAAR